MTGMLQGEETKAEQESGLLANSVHMMWLPAELLKIESDLKKLLKNPIATITAEKSASAE